MRGLAILVFLLLTSIQLPTSVLAGDGVSTSSSSGTGSTDAITNGYSSIANTGSAYDLDATSYARLIADGDFSGNFGSTCASQNSQAFAEILYTLELASMSNQSITMLAYSETEHDISTGWSDVTSLKMYANVTDNDGAWTAWSSTSANNSLSPSSSEISLGDITPRTNGTIDVLVRIEHSGVWTSACHAELFVYDFQSEVSAPSIDYAGSPFTFTKNATISTVSPTNSGGVATSWSITSGSLPAGLSFSTSTGAITGTPTAVTATTASITIEASNSAGSDSTTISITVEDPALMDNDDDGDDISGDIKDDGAGNADDEGAVAARKKKTVTKGVKKKKVVKRKAADIAAAAAAAGDGDDDAAVLRPKKAKRKTTSKVKTGSTFYADTDVKGKRRKRGGNSTSAAK